MIKKNKKNKKNKFNNSNLSKESLKDILSAEMNAKIIEKETEKDLAPISQKQLQKHEKLVESVDLEPIVTNGSKIQQYMHAKGFAKKLLFLSLTKEEKLEMKLEALENKKNEIQIKEPNQILLKNEKDEIQITDSKLVSLRDKKSKNQKKIETKIQQIKNKEIDNNTVEAQKDLSNKIEEHLQKTSIKKAFSYLTLTKEQKKIIKNKKIASNESIEAIKSDFNLNNVFEVKDFNLWYNNRQKQALFNINIALKRRKVTALIGPSGCGKSTFIRCLNRMNDLIPNIITEGNIYFDNGVNVKSKKLDRLELTTRVGMVFQKPSPFPMSIYENVAYGPKSHGILEKKVLDQIVKNSLVGAALWDEVKNNLHDLGTSLSGGQQQRLCIARAIALEPEVLLMDEPTSGLDPIATSKIENLINHLKQKYTIIIVTHSMAQAQRISDETVFFYQGEVIEHGSTKQIFTSPKQKKTKDYISGRIG